MPLTPWLSHYKTDFELARRRRGESIQFDDLRCEAFDRFLLLGFPTTADYAWRFTDITQLVESNFSLASKPQAPVLERLCHVELVFVNGYFVPDASSTAALNGRAIVGPLLPLLRSDSGDLAPYFANIARFEAAPFVALNTALFEEGAAVIIAPGTTLEMPIHLRFLCNGEGDAKPAMSQPRSLIVLGDTSRATVVESYSGANAANYFTNAVTEVYVGERAALHHHRIQGESPGAHHIGMMHAVCARGSEYRSTTVTACGMLARTETAVLLGGEGARCNVTGFYFAGQRRHVDTHTVIDYAMPACTSSQRYAGIVAAGGRGVFSGQNIVRPDAEKMATESIRVQRLPAGHTRELQAFTRAILNRIPVTLNATVQQLLETAVQTLGVPKGSVRPGGQPLV